MAIHIGYERGGWRGLIAAGVCFIMPAVLIVLVLAWAYVEYGSTPQGDALLYGIKPVIIAIVLQALVRLAPKALKSPLLWVIGAAALALYLLGYNELLILFGGAFLFMGVQALRGFSGTLALVLLGGGPAAVLQADTAAPITLWRIFLVFLKVGALLYGSGYVLLAFLRNDLVVNYGWLTDQQLLDAVAVGQFTPGPVFTTATFVGYLLAGVPGAVVATIGIFLPSFLFVALLARIMPHLRKSQWTAAFLDGINVTALALMAGVLWQIGQRGHRRHSHCDPGPCRCLPAVSVQDQLGMAGGSGRPHRAGALLCAGPVLELAYGGTMKIAVQALDCRYDLAGRLVAGQPVQPHQGLAILAHHDPAQPPILLEEIACVHKAAAHEEIVGLAFGQLAQRSCRTGDIRVGKLTVGRQPQQVYDAGRHLPHLVAQHRHQLARGGLRRIWRARIGSPATYDGGAQIDGTQPAHFDIKGRVRLERHGEIRAALLGRGVRLILQRKAFLAQQQQGRLEFGPQVEQPAHIAALLSLARILVRLLPANSRKRRESRTQPANSDLNSP